MELFKQANVTPLGTWGYLILLLLYSLSPTAPAGSLCTSVQPMWPCVLLLGLGAYVTNKQLLIPSVQCRVSHVGPAPLLQGGNPFHSSKVKRRQSKQWPVSGQGLRNLGDWVIVRPEEFYFVEFRNHIFSHPFMLL